jgi:hydroxymethylglutaryl-CoA lyase
MSFPASVRIVEVGPRDGLQNEAQTIPAETKLALIEALADAGLTTIESGAYVSPKWVPQMATTHAVMTELRRRPGVTYPVLVPNLQGLEQAIADGATEVAIFAAASESFSRKNINCSIAESLARFQPVAARAHAAGVRLRGYLSCVLGCPYEGEVTPEAVAQATGALFGLGCYEVSLGDTVGVGTPAKAKRLVAGLADRFGVERLALHFHDTYGQALANLYACLELGVSVVDSSVAGLGGCPYAKGATGNLATEDAVYMLHGMGIATGVDLSALCRAGAMISAALGKPTASRAGRAMAAKG